MEFIKAGWKILLPLMAIALLGLWLLSKPGALSPEDQIKQNFTAIAEAVGRGDAQTICQNLSDQGRRWTLQYSAYANPLSCQQAVTAGLRELSGEERKRISETKVTRVVVLGDRARVWIEPIVIEEVPQPMPFVLTANGWKAG